MFAFLLHCGLVLGFPTAFSLASVFVGLVSLAFELSDFLHAVWMTITVVRLEIIPAIILMGAVPTPVVYPRPMLCG